MVFPNRLAQCFRHLCVQKTHWIFPDAIPKLAKTSKPQSLRVSFIRNFHPLSPLSPFQFNRSPDLQLAPEWRLFPRSPPPVVSDLHSPWPTPTPMDSGTEGTAGTRIHCWVLLRILQFWGNVLRWRNSLVGVLLLISLMVLCIQMVLPNQLCSAKRENAFTIHAKNKVK